LWPNDHKNDLEGAKMLNRKGPMPRTDNLTNKKEKEKPQCSAPAAHHDAAADWGAETLL